MWCLQEQSFHHPLLLEILAKEVGASVEDIVDFELSLFDTQPGVIGGRSSRQYGQGDLQQ